jgi:RecB family exonuclease
MKASQFSDAQKAFILKQIRGHAAAGDEEAEAARGRECAAEKDRRDLTLDREMFQDVIRRKL